MKFGCLRNCGQHRGHRAFDVAGPAAVNASIANFSSEWFDGHHIFGDCVLMDIPQQKLSTLAWARVPAKHEKQIIAARMNSLAKPWQAEFFAPRLQEVGEAA